MAFDITLNAALDLRKEQERSTTPELPELTLAELPMSMRLPNGLREPVTWKKEEWRHRHCMRNSRRLRCPRRPAGVHPPLAVRVASMTEKKECEKEERLQNCLKSHPKG